MARIHGGEMVARMLERAGVRELFTLHGGHIDPILEACDRHRFRIIDTRHEQAAAHMADGWARTTGRLGVCVVTAGPGITDAVTGVANAYMDCVPMLVLAGRSPLTDDETLPLQGFPQLEMMRPITKWARCVTHPERIPEYVAMAVREATTGRPGPVYLELPIDVLFAQRDEEEVRWPSRLRPEHRPAAPQATVESVLDLLEKAERPAVLAGGGVWFSGGAPALRELAETAGVPVFMNAKTRGSVPEDGGLGFGGFTLLASPVLRDEAGPPDLVLLLGARLGLFTGGRRNSVIPPEATVVQVDIEGEEIGRNRDVEVGIVADCGVFLGQVLDGARRRRWRIRERWLEALSRARAAQEQAFAPVLEREGSPIHPYRLAKEIAQRLGPDDVVVADGGEAASWIGDAVRMRRPGRFLSHGYLGCLGVGLPFAAACKLAHPDARVLLVTGDGSAGLNFAEVDTAARHRLPFVCVIFNDQAWGMSRHGQQILFQGRTVATELGLVRYERAAEGFGAHAEFVESPAEIGPALDRAFASGRVACVNAAIDPEVIAPVTLAMMGLGGGSRGASGSSRETVLPYYGRRQLGEGSRPS